MKHPEAVDSLPGAPLPDRSLIDVLPKVLMDVPDVVFAFTRDGRYLFVNRAAAEFLNVEPIHAIGRHWEDLGFRSEIMLPFAQRVEIVSATGRAQYYRSTTSPDRGDRVFDTSLTPVWSDEGNILAVLCIARDITEFFPAARQ